MATIALVIYSGASLRALSIGGVRQMYRISRDENITCACFLRSTGLRHPSLSMSLGVPSSLIRLAFSWKTHRFENALESGSKRKRIHIVLVWTQRIKTKTMTENIAGAGVCSMPIEFNVTTRNSIVFECFSVNSRNLVKTRARAGENRTILPSKGVFRRKSGPVGSYMRAQRYSGPFVFDITVYNFLF